MSCAKTSRVSGLTRGQLPLRFVSGSTPCTASTTTATKATQATIRRDLSGGKTTPPIHTRPARVDEDSSMSSLSSPSLNSTTSSPSSSIEETQQTRAPLRQANRTARDNGNDVGDIHGKEMKGHRITVRRWKCDVCGVKYFDTFEEACQHERECQLEKDRREQLLDQERQRQQQEEQERQDVEQQQRMRPQRQRQRQQQQRQQNVEPTNFPTETSNDTGKKSTMGKKSRKSPKRKAALVLKPVATVPTAPSSSSAATTAAGLTGKNKRASAKKKGTSVAPSSFFAPHKAAKRQPQSSATVASSRVSSKKATSTSGTPHPFFAPKKKNHTFTAPGGDSAHTSSKDGELVNVEDEITVVEPPSSSSTPKSSKRSKRHREKHVDEDGAKGSPGIVEITSSSDNDNGIEVQVIETADVTQVPSPKKKHKATRSSRSRRTQPTPPPDGTVAIDVDEVAATANALAKMIDIEAEKTTKLAGIFISKSFLAEQRQAEFQAQRRMQRRREMERQEKRSTVSTVLTQAPAATKRLTNMPTKPAREQLPLAERFPFFSHVVPVGHETGHISQPLASQWTDGKSWSITTAQNNLNTSAPLKLTSSQLELHYDITSSHDLLEEAISDIVEISEDKSPGGDRCLWVDKYGMQQGLVGSAPAEASKALSSWIEQWKIARGKALERMAERQERFAKKHRGSRKQARSAGGGAASSRRKRTLYVDDDDEDFLWDGEELSNICLLTGPAASGKTALVHYAVQRADCQLVEINTTDMRGGTALRHALQEATQSCSSLDLLKKKAQEEQDALHPFQNKAVLHDSDEEEEDNLTKKESSLTVILIDEVDNIYENSGHDSGFWTALHLVAKTAKCPIVLTAHCIPPEFQAAYKHVPTERPTPDDCVAKLYQVIQHEPSLRIRSGSDVSVGLQRAAEIGQCDLRKLIHTMQWFSFRQRNDVMMTRLPSPPSQKQLPAAPNCSPWKRPTILALEPCQVPFDKCSQITLHGENFSSLGQDVAVVGYIGRRRCDARVVNDDTILVQCPPLSSAGHYDDIMASVEERFAEIIIEFKPKINGSSTGSIVCAEAGRTKQIKLLDGSSLPCSQRLLVEYIIPARDDEIVEKHECENVGGCNDDIDDNEEENKQKPPADEEGTAETAGSDNTTPETTTEETDEMEGPVEIQNRRTLEDSSCMATERRKKTSPADLEMQSILEDLAYDTSIQSDATWLEEYQSGLPYLAGACRGYGFDYIEGNDTYLSSSVKPNGTNNKARVREEKLIASNWKEDYYFYGNADAYMTAPKSFKECKRLYATAMLSRGMALSETDEAPPEREEEAEEKIDAQLTTLPTTSSATSSPELDACTRSEEDLYLPRPIAVMIELFPNFLRESKKRSSHYTLPADGDKKYLFFEQRKAKSFETQQRLLSYIFHGSFVQTKMGCYRFNVRPNDMTTTSIGPPALSSSFLWQDLIDVKLYLEYLPILKHIAVLERAAERVAAVTSDNQNKNNSNKINANNQDGDDKSTTTTATTRRVTRRSTRQRQQKGAGEERTHYFDTISQYLRLDNGNENTSQVGSLLADMLMVYTPY